MISEKNNCLIYQYDNETVQIEAWGKNAVRIRATMNASFTGHDWALEEKPESWEKYRYMMTRMHPLLSMPICTAGKMNPLVPLRTGKSRQQSMRMA